ncbi:hypothetical protein VNO77_36783 [Canavalia gladiata]|uniref:Uncharacterized protein n=1 Tax=Canavalia gladiata TaxID=3824 RepID=A0AAN9PWE3_CANGL
MTLGGASFNPSTNISFYIARLRPNSSLASMAIRFPSQAAGGAIAAKVLLLVIPTQYKHMLKGPFLKVYLLSVAIVALIILGSGFTGPAMNLGFAFGWAYMNNKHNTREHFYVYWICPFVGSTLAALVYRFLFISPTNKKKA